MKKFFTFLIILVLLLSSCSAVETPSQIAATTLPIYEFTMRLCEGTGITVTRLVTESVSCLHDYTLQVSQMRAIESAESIAISGAGLEGFLEEALVHAGTVIDASHGIEVICPDDDHGHDHDDHDHHHDRDPHIWLSPIHAIQMAVNLCGGLCAQYPEHQERFQENLAALRSDLLALQAYGETQLADLSCRKLITFHDGFGYFAECFGLTILEAVEEESGSEASASELIALITMVRDHRLPAIFIETNGSSAAALTIAAETGISVFTLDMAMAGDSYFDAMYHNIDTIKEALG